jgi:hypothetical protein
LGYCQHEGLVNFYIHVVINFSYSNDKHSETMRPIGHRVLYEYISFVQADFQIEHSCVISNSSTGCEMDAMPGSFLGEGINVGACP